MTSLDDDRLYVFLGGDPNSTAKFQEYNRSQPFDVASAPDGSAWVTNSGGLLGLLPSSVAKFILVNRVIQRQFLQCIGKSLKAVSVDSEGNAWIASKGDDS